MTSSISEVTSPGAGDAGTGRAPGAFTRRRGSTSLRVGAASIWLSVIVLLPLAAIVFQAAGGGFGAFWTAATSPASAWSTP